jgi:hypothetical protein
MLAERASRTAGKTVEALGMNRLRLSERPLTFFNRDPPDGALGQAEIAAVGGQRQEAASPRVADALLRVSALNREPKIAIEEGLPLTLFPPQLFSAPTTMWKTVLPGSPCRSGSCWPRSGPPSDSFDSVSGVVGTPIGGTHMKAYPVDSGVSKCRV